MANTRSFPQLHQTTRIRRRRFALWRVLLHLVLSIGALLMVLPFFWMISTSLKAEGDVLRVPPQWLPNPIVWSNYAESWTALPMGQAYVNSLKVASISTIGTILSSSLAGFAFAKLHFYGRGWLLLVLLATLMVPVQATLIPTYILFRWFGWLDTHWPLIVPAVLTNAYGVFLFRQFFRTIPDDLADAARVDGAGPLRIYAQIFLPLAIPAVAALGILDFMYYWNEYLLPLIFLSSVDRFTLPLMLASFQNGYTTQWSLLMAASAIALVPVMLVYLLAQRYFVEGIALTGLKG
ncbi:carbohydrate ABC transporter permease [Candidatus Gracilibacteria bacterium]|nr:carbohydrate ABC transporter permease [Candidatus Gracilibacteria bacterium]